MKGATGGGETADCAIRAFSAFDTKEGGFPALCVVVDVDVDAAGGGEDGAGFGFVFEFDELFVPDRGAILATFLVFDSEIESWSCFDPRENDAGTGLGGIAGVFETEDDEGGFCGCDAGLGACTEAGLATCCALDDDEDDEDDEEDDEEGKDDLEVETGLLSSDSLSAMEGLTGGGLRRIGACLGSSLAASCRASCCLSFSLPSSMARKKAGKNGAKSLALAVEFIFFFSRSPPLSSSRGLCGAPVPPLKDGSERKQPRNPVKLSVHDVPGPARTDPRRFPLSLS